MLPLNILLLSMALVVFSKVSAAAPLEVEKDEVEIEGGEEAEGELSEEEEGILIGQHSTAVPSKGSGPAGSPAADFTSTSTAVGVNGPSPGSEGSNTRPEAGSVASAGASGSHGGPTGASGSPAGSVSSGGPGGSIPGPEGGSVGSLLDPGPGPVSFSESPGPAPNSSGLDGAESDSNGNGHKFMNGAKTDNGPITSPDSGSHLGPGSDPGPDFGPDPGPGSDPGPGHGPDPGPGSNPGPDLGPGPGSHPGSDPASHDFLLSLKGGSDPFGADLTPKPTMYQTGASPAVSLAPDPGPVLDSGTEHALLPALVQPAVNPVVDPALPDTPVSADSPDSLDSPDYNGNGRLTVISQSVTHQVPEVQTMALPTSHDLNGNTDAVTSFPFELTASGLGLGPDATEPSHVLLHTESVDHVTHLLSTGVFSQTELVTSVTETATDSGATAVTDVPLTNTKPGPDPGPATESYYSQGPEGSENVELEDSC